MLKKKKILESLGVECKLHMKGGKECEWQAMKALQRCHCTVRLEADGELFPCIQGEAVKIKAGYSFAA